MSGSPIPMKTTLVTCLGGVNRRISRTCPAISNISRLRVKPIAPVAQKAHCSAQPACEEMQSVRREPSGIATVSMNSPSSRRNRNFSVPSLEVCLAASVSRGIVKCSSRRFLNATGMSVIASKLSTALCHRCRATCEPRNGFSPCSTAKVRSTFSASKGSMLSRFCFIGSAREKRPSRANREARSFHQVYATTKFNPSQCLIRPTRPGADLHGLHIPLRHRKALSSGRRAPSVPRWRQSQTRRVGT